MFRNNKKGKGGVNATNVVVIIGIVIIAAVALLIGYNQLTESGREKNIVIPLSAQGVDGAVTPVITTNDGCNVNPSVSLVAVDNAVSGTSVLAGGLYRINGFSTGTSASPAKGDQLDVIFTNASYISEVVKGYNVQCGVNRIPSTGAVKMKAFAAPALTMFTNAGTATLTNATTGGTNETNFVAGGSKNWKIYIDGTGDKTTGNMMLIVEMPTNSAANVTDSGVTLSCGGAVMPKSNVPSSIVASNTNSYRAAWIIPEILGGVRKECNLQVSLQGSYRLGGASAVVYTTYYTIQPFIDIDGSIVTDKIVDSYGASKYLSSSAYNFAING